MFSKSRASLIVLFLLIGSSAAAPPVLVRSVPMPTTAPTTQGSAPADYTRIRNWIGAHPADGLTSWGFTAEHLFVSDNYGDFGTPSSLRALCFEFVRSPAGLDLLFKKIRDLSTNDDELIAIAEVLAFWNDYDEPTDDAVRSRFADQALEAIANGRAASVDAKYPDLHVSRRLKQAAEKARPSKNTPTSVPSR